MIRVVHLQTYAESTGSAALRLHKAFANSGFHSTLITLRSGINDDEKIIQKNKNSKRIAWINNKIQTFLNRNNVKEFGLFSYPVLGTDFSKMKGVKNADVIYIHWVLNGFMNLLNIEQILKLGKPVIFFMHDMWSITGGCHYSFTCDKYKIHCNNCHIFPTHKKRDLSFIEFEKKSMLYAKYTNLYFVSPSRWLLDCAKKSFLTKDKPIFYIPNIIDNKLFKPFDKKIAKQILNLDEDEIIIAFGATSVDSPYKGWSYLQKSLEILKQDTQLKNISVLVFGSGYNKQIADAIPYKARFMGYLMDDYSISLMYNAADVFVVPSLADNQPTTVMESICCGTPVVGFDIGGIPDMISHKENGYLAKYKDASDISEGIKFCVTNKIKGYALPQFNPDIIMNKHLELFQQIHLLNNMETIEEN